MENDNKTKKKAKIKFSLYDLEKKDLLGSGVSGQVFFVKHIITNKNFALKVIPLKNDTQMKTLIENEVKILHSCKCDNIVKCYSTYFDNGAINILLEFMDKGTLADLLKKVKRIPEKILGYITYQILIGLDYLHINKRIVHRDIKPSNILINSKGQVKISDFGVSSIVIDSMKGKETLVGTYNYMSPERIKVNNYSFVSDVWSIAMSIFESAIGIYPFYYNNDEPKANDFWSLHNMIDQINLPELSKDEFSEEFSDFIKICLEKDPLKRPNSRQLLEHPFIVKFSKIKDNSEFIIWLKSI